MTRGWIAECGDGCGVLDADVDEMSAKAVALDHRNEDQSGNWYPNCDPAICEYHKTAARLMRESDWRELDKHHAKALGLPADTIRRWRHDGDATAVALDDFWRECFTEHAPKEARPNAVQWANPKSLW